jgi:hypothetical protein
MTWVRNDDGRFVNDVSRLEASLFGQLTDRSLFSCLAVVDETLKYSEIRRSGCALSRGDYPYRRVALHKYLVT